jgi:hypothetical protein
LEDLEDAKIAEIIRECKRKNIFDIMSFAKSWNNEVIAQFYATCYFTTGKDEKIMDWMTEGKWFGITYTQFASLLGFDGDDKTREKIHKGHDMDKEDMKFMYILGQEWNYGRVNGMLPFYAYLYRMFRKTLAPREGDQSNVSNYGSDLLKHMSHSEPEFSVVDYIWEKIHTISSSPQKSCGYAPYLMHITEAITNYTFEYDHDHKPFHLKNDVVGPSLAVLASAQANIGGQGVPEQPAAAAPSRVARPSFGRGRGHEQQHVQKPPSPLRKLFNFWCGSCMKASDAVHKERQHRKRDSRMIRLMYENPSPTNRNLIPHAPSDDEDSKSETFESIWDKSQQVDPTTNKDYWDRAYGNTYYNPTFGGMYSARSSYSEVPFMGTQGKGTSSSMPQVDPNAQGSSSTVGGYYHGSLFGSGNPYEGMASHLPPFPPPPSFVPPSQFVPPPQDDEEEP